MTRLVYLLAASHSGSTLTAMLLGAHPEVCSVGELKWTSMGDVSRYRCSCGTLIADCSFWRDISTEMAKRGLDFDIRDARTDLRAGASDLQRRLLRPLHRGPVAEWIRDLALHATPGWPAHLRAHQARNRALIESVLARSGKRVLVDSSKIGIRLKYLRRIPGLDIRVIRVMRDGRAVSLTYTDPATFADATRQDLKGGGSGASRDHQRLPMAVAAREWRRSNEEADSVLRQMRRDEWIAVRYEDLCADPMGTLRRLSEFIGVDPDAVRLDFRSVEHHVVGNGMRLDTASEIRLDERWREALGPGELRTFADVAGPLNRRLGYV
jgi:hypothetical protein